MAGPRHALTRRSKGQRSRSHGYEVCCERGCDDLVSSYMIFYGAPCVCVFACVGRHPVYRWDYSSMSAAVQPTISEGQVLLDVYFHLFEQQMANNAFTTHLAFNNLTKSAPER